MQDIYSALFIYVVIVLSAVIHEYSHGYVADSLGDPTARMAGRLTLNPLAHMELFGTVLIPAILLLTSGSFLGWAKPVPVNPFRLRGKNALLKVSLAGPLSNFMIAILISGGVMVLHFLAPGVIPQNSTLSFLIAQIIYVNIVLAVFNLIPVPPLDGSKVLDDLMGGKFLPSMSAVGPVGIIVAILLGMMIIPPVASFIFNLITFSSFAL